MSRNLFNFDVYEEDERELNIIHIEQRMPLSSDMLIDLMDKVEYILQTYPQTRNSDNLLCAYYWKEFDGLDGYVDLVELENVTSAGAIERFRRKLTERNLYLPTDPEVLKQRRISQERMRATINQT